MTTSLISQYRELQDSLVRLREDLLLFEQRVCRETLVPLCDSARNLIHYLALRQQDIRCLQSRLSQAGLSTLSNSTTHTLDQLNTMITLLERIRGQWLDVPNAPVDYVTGSRLLEMQTERLLGLAQDAHQGVRIMVTMPSEAASEPSLVRDLLVEGMSVMRINCAHDQPDDWQDMVQNLRKAEKESGLTCKIQADLGGPKLRTGNILSGDRILKLKPQRNEQGQTVRPCQIWLTSDAQPEPPPVRGMVVLRVCFTLLKKAKCSDVIVFRDHRNKKRQMTIEYKQQGGCVAQLEQTAYLSSDVVLSLKRQDKTLVQSVIQSLPEVASPVVLKVGDELTLVRDGELKTKSHMAKRELATVPVQIHCDLPEAFTAAEQGQRVWFDDGRIGGVIRAVSENEMNIQITRSAEGGSKLRPEKGINFPDSDLQLPALTEKDKQDLASVIPWADMIALSFVQKREDVEELHELMLTMGYPETGIVLKIENKQAFEHLPDLLLTGLRLKRPFGVMIARGDLAVEVGFERLAEVQQEIIWLCEAAHVPVIWATQILESKAKKGFPTRSEVSDASMAISTECAMLNKGPYIVETVALLKGILSRMDRHFHKRQIMLRKLAVASFLPEAISKNRQSEIKNQQEEPVV